jgi:hypothetical protein
MSSNLFLDWSREWGIGAIAVSTENPDKARARSYARPRCLLSAVPTPPESVATVAALPPSPRPTLVLASPARFSRFTPHRFRLAR